MKYVVLIGDGMADRPLKSLGHKTCLQIAKTPNMDWLASNGQPGKVSTIPKGLEPGSDVANLSILGYDPLQYYSGRAPIEAEYRGIKLGRDDIAFRCNLVTLGSPGTKAEAMKDFSAGHITTKEAGAIIKEIINAFKSNDITFYPGISYRHLMIWKNGKEKMRCTPPHDITGKKTAGYMPKGRGADVLVSLMERSKEVLDKSPVNKNRVARGLDPANSIWLWGQGRRLSVPSFKKKYGLDGALISAVDLTKGLGICAGFKVINVKGATGYIDTNYIGKANAALKALNICDFVYIHVEAPDEAGHSGSVKDKIKAIEDFDKKVVGTVLKGIKRFGDYRILLMPDHATPIRLMTHTVEPVPYVIYGTDRQSRGHVLRPYNEYICRMKNIHSFEKGHKLMDYFLEK